MQAIEIRPTARRLGVCAETRRGPDGHRTGSVDRSGKCNGPGAATISSGREGCCNCVQLYCLLPAGRLLPCELVVIPTQKRKCNLAECCLESIPNAVLKCIWAIV